MYFPPSLKTARFDYRADIDGIRALAVLSVFVYHLESNFLPGGFLGVDIFFVISGYLITNIIVRENDLNSFSFIHFYVRRIKRIFPPLFVVILLAGVIATFLLTPETYVNFMASARYASGQLANIFFSREVDYFSEGFSGQPLLHTWSLGVEEQFYLFWPLLIFCCFQFLTRSEDEHWADIALHREDLLSDSGSVSGKCSDENARAGRIILRIAGVFAGIFLISYGFCYVLAEANHKLAFYMFYSRAFEFCIGGIIALNIIPRPVSSTANSLLGVFGLFILCISLYFIGEEQLGRSFLQFGVFFPCIGTALIIHANRQNGLVNRILATRLPASIGKISYSLYLYHWPVIAFWKSYTDRYDLNIADSFGIICVTFLLAILSYFLVEKPARKSTIPNSYVLGLSFLVIVVFSFVFKQLERYETASWRIAPYLNKKSVAIKAYDPGCTARGKNGLVDFSCQSNEQPNYPVIALVGDSHAPHYLRPVTAWARKNGYNVKFLKTAGCPMLLGGVRIKSNITQGHEKHCEIALPLFDSQIVNDPNVEYILIAQRFDLLHNGKGYLNTTRMITFKDDKGRVVEDHTRYYDDRLSFTVKAVRDAGKDLVLLKQVPLLGSIKACNWEPFLKKWFNQERSCSYDPSFIKKWQQPSIDFIDKFSAVHQVEIFDPMPYFTSPLQDGFNLYNDQDHINERGALFLTPFFEKEMDAIVARTRDKSQKRDVSFRVSSSSFQASVRKSQ